MFATFRKLAHKISFEALFDHLGPHKSSILSPDQANPDESYLIGMELCTLFYHLVDNFISLIVGYQKNW